MRAAYSVGVLLVFVIIQGCGGTGVPEAARDLFYSNSFNENWAPVITIAGENPKAIDVYAPYQDEGASAVSVTDGDISSRIVVNSNVNTSVLGTYNVSYRVNDSSGIESVASRSVSVVDRIAPVISLIGSNSITVNLNSIYTDPGVNVTDNYDANVASRLVIENLVNTAQLGTYTITFRVSDASQNVAVPVSREVRVVDMTPHIAITSPINQQDFGTQDIQVSGTCSANLGVNLSGGLVAPVNTVCSSSGTFGPLPVRLSTPDGSKLLRASSTSLSGVTAQMDIQVNLLTRPPTITAPSYSISLCDETLAYRLSGVSASDSIGRSLAIDESNITSDNVNRNRSGNYQVSYTVTDSVGHIATGVRQVSVDGNIGGINYNYGIDSAAGLQSISMTGLSLNYLLCKNIDIKGANFQRIGTSSNSFSGKFNGNFKTISNAVIIAGSGGNTNVSMGLFASIGAAGVVKNLTLENIRLAQTNLYAGILTGRNQGLIDHVFVSGTEASFANMRDADQVGGIVGLNLAPGIIQSTVSDVPVKGGRLVGGITGENQGNFTSNASIKNCYALGAITSEIQNNGGSSDDSAGGIVGYNNGGKIENTYATGSVSGTLRSGIVGRSNFGSVISSYWDIDSSGYFEDDPDNHPVNQYGEGKNHGEMFMLSTYAGWNFDLIWTMPVQDYPKLK